ncbi:MAG: hypothetical protein QM660_12950 [Dysgonomonas sp.]
MKNIILTTIITLGFISTQLGIPSWLEIRISNTEEQKVFVYISQKRSSKTVIEKPTIEILENNNK